MKSIRERALKGEILSGTWLITGSSVCAEIAGQAGFDWAVCDLEHGMGHLDSLLHQLQALDSTPCCPVVRVAWNEHWMIKRVLDMGACGVMIPYVNDAREAEQAAKAIRYPPQGIRGLTPLSRHAEYGKRYAEYYKEANDKILTIAQIETEKGAQNAEEIAAVDGIDVLFIGPMDLSLGLGILGQFDHPRYKEAAAKVVASCKKHGKAAGVLLLNPAQLAPTVEAGFTFIAMSSEGGEMASALTRLALAFGQYRK